jgi:CRISPR/Cas system-associated protein Csm6
MTKPNTVPKSSEELVKEEVKEVIKESQIEDTNLPEPIKEEVNISEVMKLVKAQSEQLEKLQKQNEMLLEVADSKQLANYYNRNQVKMPSIIKLRKLDGKIVVGWRMVEDLVDKNPETGR